MIRYPPGMSRRRLPGGTLLCLAFAIAPGCSADAVSPPGAGADAALPESTAVMALHDDSRERPDFFALPWPADERLITRPDGKRYLDLSGFRYAGALIGQYLDLFHDEPVTGFGTSSAVAQRVLQRGSRATAAVAVIPSAPAAS